MAKVTRVGFEDSPQEVGLIDVGHDSCIVITPDGDVELFMAKGISEQRRNEAQSFKDGVMLFVNDPDRVQRDMELGNVDPGNDQP